MVVDPDSKRALSLLPEQEVFFFHAFTNLKGLQFDMTVLAIKPQQFSSLNTDAIEVISTGLAVSIMAGVNVATMIEKLGCLWVIRRMPNLPALAG